MDEEKATLDRVKRETSARAEQDRGTINGLRDELSKVKTRCEEMRLKTEEEKSKLESKIDEIRAERDSGQQEAEDLKLQIHLLEDRNDSIQNQLQETNRKLKESKTQFFPSYRRKTGKK